MQSKNINEPKGWLPVSVDAMGRSVGWVKSRVVYGYRFWGADRSYETSESDGVSCEDQG